MPSSAPRPAPRPASRAAVLVVGSSMVDLVAYVERSPAAGETVVGRDFVVGFGGKGANQAVMAARLGADVTFAGCVGTDAYGAQIVNDLRADGVDVSQVRTVDGPSGMAPIWVEDDGSNRIVVVWGANARFTADHARDGVAAASGAQVVVGQLEVPQATTAAAFTAARAAGATTLLNPAPMAALDPDLLRHTSWLLPNEVELAQLVAARGGPSSATSGWDDARLLQVQEDLDVRLAVTLGAAGAAVVAEGTVHRVPAPQMQAVDTSGAGDAFVGAFAYGLASGLSPADAARLGCACASDSVQRHGTRASYPREATAFLAAARPAR